MSILSQLQAAGGCSGGVAIYNLAKGTVGATNLFRKRIKLWPDTKAIMRRFFPELNLNKVTFCNNSSLPGNWFTSANSVGAMTFGYNIFFKGKDIQQHWEKLELLMHELVHVDQVRKRSDDEVLFACDYGKGYLKAGSYRENPMEIEAYDFVKAHPLPASLPESLRKLPKKP